MAIRTRNKPAAARDLGPRCPHCREEVVKVHVYGMGFIPQCINTYCWYGRKSDADPSQHEEV